MVIKQTLFLILVLFLGGCALKQPVQSESAIILIKTPNMKFYDKGFIRHYANHIQVEIFSAGQAVLQLKIYEDRICKDTFKCQTLREFNKIYLNTSYKNNFLQELFTNPNKEVVFKDQTNHILIKIIKD